VVPQRPGVLELGLFVVAERLQVVGAHQGQQPLLQGGGELEWQAQVGCPGAGATSSARRISG
jgi:hypothetical protein